MASGMNSSQRRKYKREYPHSIKLVAPVLVSYFEHDDKVESARSWCNKNTKRYKVDVSWDHAMFKFALEKDAVYFALKWV